MSHVTWNLPQFITILQILPCMQYSSMLIWHSCEPYLRLFHWLYTWVAHMWYVTRKQKWHTNAREQNLSKFSKCKPHIMSINMSIETVFNIDLTCKFCAKHTQFLLVNNLMDNSNIVRLSMESRKQIITLCNVLSYPLFNHQWHTPETLLLANQMFHVLLISQNNRNYSKHMLHTHSSCVISASAGIWYLLLCL